MNINSDVFRIALIKVEYETKIKTRLEKARNKIVKEAGLNGWI